MDRIERFKAEIRFRIQHAEPEEIARFMGYSKIDDAGQRMLKVLDDPFMRLNQSDYDFRYSSRDFILALSDSLGVDEHVRDEAIAEIEDRIEKESDWFRPRLFADTAFKRSTEPVMVLAVTQHLRWVALPTVSCDDTVPELVQKCCAIAAEHFEHSDGEILIFGKIQRYLLNYAPDIWLIITPDGRVIGEETDFFIPGAAIQINGRKIEDIEKLLGPVG